MSYVHWQLQRVEQEAEAARRTLGLQTEEDKKRAQFADELERKRHVDQVRKYRLWQCSRTFDGFFMSTGKTFAFCALC